jgi:hypothetical protein
MAAARVPAASVTTARSSCGPTASLVVRQSAA